MIEQGLKIIFVALAFASGVTFLVLAFKRFRARDGDAVLHMCVGAAALYLGVLFGMMLVKTL